MRAAAFLFLLITTASVSPAFACSPPPLPFQLPGESDQAYHERKQAYLRAQNDEQQRSYQISLEDQAKVIFVGVASASRDGQVGHEVTVRPARALKGALPNAPAVLRDAVLTTCGYAGGGSATVARPGDFVIVFEGLDGVYTGGTGTIGIFASEARTPFLLQALMETGREGSR